MAVWCRWDKFIVTQWKDGCIFKTKMIGYKYFELGKNEPPIIERGVTPDKPEFFVATAADLIISPTEPEGLS